MTALFVAPRVPLVDTTSGICNPIWYRFFADLFSSLGGGGGGTVPDIEGAFLLPYGSSISDEMLVRVGAVSDDFNEGGLLPPPVESGVFSISFGTTGLTPATATKGQVTVAGILGTANGGTNSDTPSGTALDNITGFSGTGHLVRTGSGAYSFRTMTGTANRLSVTNGDGVAGNPTFDISASYVGQASITTLGTITTGTWNGTAIAAGSGGTGLATYTAGDLIYATGATTLVKLAIGANNFILGSNGTAPIWVTNTGTGNAVRATLPQFTSTIGVGAAASASGSGVSFPATQSPSTDPNTLDDYEEGTWTPVVTAVGGTITAYTASGAYTKIGRTVIATAQASITNNGTGATALLFTLPFTNNSGQAYHGTGRESGLFFVQLFAEASIASTTALVAKYDGTYPGGTGAIVKFTITYTV